MKATERNDKVVGLVLVGIDMARMYRDSIEPGLLCYDWLNALRIQLELIHSTVVKSSDSKIEDQIKTGIAMAEQYCNGAESGFGYDLIHAIRTHMQVILNTIKTRVVG